MAIQTKHFTTPIVVKRKRPKSLSDPYQDHGPDYLAKLLTTPDGQMGWQEFRSILGPFLPAGTYEESVYFLPLAFDLLHSEEDQGYDLGRSLVWFTSEHADQLREDELLDACRDAIRELLSLWIFDFDVIHYDREAARAKGWQIPYADHVRYSEDVCCCTCDLVEFKVHRDIAVEFYSRVKANVEDPVSAAWLLELWRAQADVHHPPVDEPITAAINDLESLRAAASTVRRSVVANATSPTYWNDVLAGF